MKLKLTALTTALSLALSLILIPAAAAALAESLPTLPGEPQPVHIEKDVPALEDFDETVPKDFSDIALSFPLEAPVLSVEPLDFALMSVSQDSTAPANAVLIESSQNGKTTALVYCTLSENHTASVVLVEAANGMVVIPRTFTEGGEEYTVTSVAPSAFAGQGRLTQVWLPETVEAIGYDAFRDCDLLKAVGTYFPSGESDPYTLPPRLTLIEPRTFRGCTQLSSVRIPAGVTLIDAWAFAYCYYLGQNYTDAAGVTYGVYFEEESRLERISQGAFTHCMSLENISLPEGLYEIELDAFSYCLALKSITIPAGVRHLPQKTFYSCSALEAVYFTGDGLESMGHSAFFWCTKLKTIRTAGKPSLPSTLRSIPRWTFYRCDSLGELDLSSMSALREIEPYAFNESGVTSVTFPQTLLKVGALAFQGCKNLTEINWNRPENDTELLSVGQMSFAQTGLVHVTLPQLYTKTGDSLFYDCDQLQTVTLLEPALFIPQGAFRDCDSLRKVTFSKAMLDIGSMAFYSCPKLVTANFTEAVNLRNIGEVAFCRTGFTSVTLPAGVQCIGNNAFGINRAFTAFFVDGDATLGGYFTQDGVLYRNTAEEGLTLVKYPAGKTASSFVVDDQVSHIAPYAFSHSEYLETVIFPGNLRSIGDYAFSHCIRLQTAKLPQNVTLGDDVFGGCSRLTHALIPEGTVSIGNQDFPSYSQVTTITLPASAETLNDINPFSLLTNLEEFRVAEGNRHFKAVDGVLFSADGTTLLAYPIAKAGSQYRIPDGVTTINAWAFQGAAHLEHIIFPASVETVGPSACHDLPKLSRVDICREDIIMDKDNPNAPGYHAFLGECARNVEVFLTGDPNDPNNGKEKDQKAYRFYYQCRTSGDNTVDINNIHVSYFKTPSQPGDRFVEDGVIYTLDSQNTVLVGDNTHYPSNTLTIPARVSHDGTEYTVTAIASGAFRGLSGLRVILAGASIQVASDAFEAGVQPQVGPTSDTFETVKSDLAYGDVLALMVPSSLSNGAHVTLEGGISAKAEGGLALFPVDKAMVDVLGFGEQRVIVRCGSVTGKITLTLSPKLYTAADLPGQSNLNGALLIEKPYDGTDRLDYTSSLPLRNFLLPGDEVTLHVTGRTASPQVINHIIPISEPAAELIGRDAKYYALASDVKTSMKVKLVYGQLYIREANGFLQQPTFLRVWSPEDGMRIRDCNLSGGAFIAYLPIVDNGSITGYETVDVNGTITYDEENHYPGVSSFDQLGVQMNEVYHWVFTPQNNGDRDAILSNYRFYGTVKLWDPSLLKGPDTLKGTTGENPPLPGYVTAAVLNIPDVPEQVSKTPAAASPTQNPDSGSSSGGSSRPSGGNADRPSGSTAAVAQPKPAETPAQASVQVFTDVPVGSPHATAVQYVYEKGIMKGLTATDFGPEVPTSRAMIVTLLYRLEDEPKTASDTFSDVSSKAYYAAPVAWAKANGIVTGHKDGAFRPNDGVTWEQLAAILYRYAGVKGYDRTSRADLNAGKISSFAREPLAWMLAEGLLDNVQHLNPKAAVTRAEIADILMYFCENVAK